MATVKLVRARRACVEFRLRCRHYATVISVLVPEFGEGAQRPKAGKVEDFAYCAPLNAVVADSGIERSSGRTAPRRMHTLEEMSWR